MTVARMVSRTVTVGQPPGVSGLAGEHEGRRLLEVLDPRLRSVGFDDRQDHELGGADGDEPIDRVHQRVPRLRYQDGRIGEIGSALGEQFDDRRWQRAR